MNTLMADQRRREDESQNTQDQDAPSFDQIKLAPWYKDIEDEITQPDQVIVQSKYFWKRWASLLGPGPTVLLLRLRQYCYYNRQTGELRDMCWPKQETLAREIGISDRESLRAYLVVLEGYGFIRREADYRYDPALRKKVRTTDKYHVRMWDPVAPEDEGLALVKAAERMLREQPNPLGNPIDGPKAEKPPQVDSAGDNPRPKAEKPPYGAGGKTASRTSTLNEYNERNVAVVPTQTEADRAATERTIHLYSERPESVGGAIRRGLRRRQPLKEPAKGKSLAGALAGIQTSPETRDRLLRVEDLGEQIVSQLGDTRSQVFYRKVARRFLEAGQEQLVYRVLSEVKEGQRDARLHNPAAVFTARIKELAEMNDIIL